MYEKRPGNWMKLYQVPTEERCQHIRTIDYGAAKTKDGKLAGWEELERYTGIETYRETS